MGWTAHEGKLPFPLPINASSAALKRTHPVQVFGSRGAGRQGPLLVNAGVRTEPGAEPRPAAKAAASPPREKRRMRLRQVPQASEVTGAREEWRTRDRMGRGWLWRLRIVWDEM